MSPLLLVGRSLLLVACRPVLLITHHLECLSPSLLEFLCPSLAPSWLTPSSCPPLAAPSRGAASCCTLDASTPLVLVPNIAHKLSSTPSPLSQNCRASSCLLPLPFPEIAARALIYKLMPPSSDLPPVLPPPATGAWSRRSAASDFPCRKFLPARS